MDIKSNEKYLGPIVIGLLVLVIANFFGKIGKGILDKLGITNSEDFTKAEEKKVKELVVTPAMLSYNPGWYLEAASTLYDAMEGAGTKEEVIFEIIGKLKTQADWNQLQKAFGVRDGASLTSWFRADLSATENTDLKNLLNYLGRYKAYAANTIPNKKVVTLYVIEKGKLTPSVNVNNGVYVGDVLQETVFKDSPAAWLLVKNPNGKAYYVLKSQVKQQKSN